MNQSANEILRQVSSMGPIPKSRAFKVKNLLRASAEKKAANNALKQLMANGIPASSKPIKMNNQTRKGRKSRKGRKQRKTRRN